MNHESVYSQAKYYDLVHGRNVTKDLDFFQAVFKKFCNRELYSILDLACGPGYHVLEASKRNITATGVDINISMLDFARTTASANLQNATWSHQDIRGFKLDKKFDIAICLYDTIALLTSNDELVGHLNNVADHIIPGGLYIIEMTHPRWNSIVHFEVFRDTGIGDGISVEITYGSNSPVPDLITGSALIEVEMKVNDHGKELTFKDSAIERAICPQEIILLAQLCGSFNVMAWFGDFNIDQPLDTTPQSSRMICVLQSKQ